MQPPQFSRRGFFQGLGSLVGASVIGCAAEPQTSKITFGYQQYSRLSAQHSAGLTVSSGRLLALAARNQDLSNGLGDRNQMVEMSSLADPRPFLNLPNEAGLFVGGMTLASPDSAFVTGNALYEVSLSTPVVRRTVPLASGNMRSNGSLKVGDKLFVTASHPLNLAGALNVYDLGPDGTIVGAGRSVATAGANPTGIAASGPEVLVLNTGDYESGSIAYLNFFDGNGQKTRDALPLGNMTAQNSGSIAVGQNIAVIGTSDRSGRLVFVDVNAGEVIDSPVSIPGHNFHSSVVIGNIQGRDYVFATDYNSGSVAILDMEDRTVIATLALPERAGPALFHEGALIQTVPNAALRVFVS